MFVRNSYLKLLFLHLYSNVLQSRMKLSRFGIIKSFLISSKSRHTVLADCLPKIQIKDQIRNMYLYYNCNYIVCKTTCSNSLCSLLPKSLFCYLSAQCKEDLLISSLPCKKVPFFSSYTKGCPKGLF